MGGKVSTNSVCSFPLTFENNDDFKGEERFNPENEVACTQTLAESYGDFWDVLHYSSLFLYFGIFLPLFLMRFYKLKQFANHSKQRLRDTMQFKVYCWATVLVLLQGLASIDLHGLNNDLPIQLYLFFTQCSLFAMVVTDFLVKTSASNFKQEGINEKLIHHLLIFFFIFFVGLGAVAIFCINKFNFILGIRRAFEFLIAVGVFFLSRYYKNKLIKKIDDMQHVMTGTTKVSQRINRSFRQYHTAIWLAAIVNIALSFNSLLLVFEGEPGLVYDRNEKSTIIGIVVGRISFAVLPASFLLVFKTPTISNSVVDSDSSENRKMATETSLGQNKNFYSSTLRNLDNTSKLSTNNMRPYLGSNVFLSSTARNFAIISENNGSNNTLRATEILEPSDDWDTRSSFTGLPRMNPRSVAKSLSQL
eukprot:snap_masked-scaffold_3-processed-gene-21.66-mRNA-1 protein AED:1.00 eAED:1.00 QI:0/0/0/0/1/1/2/0/418